jgi:hypothetical protein
VRAGIWNSTTSPTAIVAEVGENAVNDGAVKVATGVLPAQATVMTVEGAASTGVPASSPPHAARQRVANRA